MIDLSTIPKDPARLRALAKMHLESKAQKDQIAKAQANFYEFVRLAWHVVEPSRPFVENWHTQAICKCLQAVTEGKIKNLLINVCPGAAKSLIVSVLWPAWVWLRNPQWRGIFSSYSGDLVLRDAVRSRALIESPWYQRSFKPKWKLSDDQNAKSNYENTEKGFRFSTSVGARASGFRGDALICDDPLNAKEQFSDAALEECVFWWNNVMSSRLNDLATGQKIVIMQRLSSRDLSEHLKDYVHLRLPTEFEPDNKCEIWLNGEKFWEDPRTEAGELMFPQMFPRDVVEQIKIDLGANGFAGQHQQRPSPAEGGMFKKFWWKYWQPRGANLKPVPVKLADGTLEMREAVTLPDNFGTTLASWDMAFKDTKTSDFTAGLVVGALGADRFVLDCEHGRMDLPEVLNAVRRLSMRWPNAHLKLIEDKANGPAVIQSLRHEIGGLVEVNPEGGKIARANAAAPSVESGNWYLPHPALAPWVQKLIDECGAFPAGAHDDLCLVAGTKIATEFGDKPIEDIRRGDRVLTPLGLCNVSCAGISGVSETSIYSGVEGTGSHPFFTYDSGFIRMDALTQASMCDILSLCGLIRWNALKLLNSMESPTDSWEGRDVITSASQALTLEEKTLRVCMSLCGKLLMDGQLMPVLMFIIKIIIHSIITLKTWSLYRAANILHSTPWLESVSKNNSSIWMKSEIKPRSGTLLRRVLHGTRSMAKNVGWGVSQKLCTVFSAVLSSLPLCPQNIALLNADTSIGDLSGYMMSPLNVRFAEPILKPLSRSIPVAREQPVVESVKKKKGSKVVYNLSVDGAGCYYANGVLVSNCDALSQACIRMLYTTPKSRTAKKPYQPYQPTGEREWMS